MGNILTYPDYISVQILEYENGMMEGIVNVGTDPLTIHH
jgi:hypothetical protein